MSRFKQLYCDIDHSLACGGNKEWPADVIWERMVEEIGEIARCRRPAEYSRNSDVGRNDEEGEVLDLLYATLTYARARGFKLEERWKSDTYGRELPVIPESLTSAHVEAPEEYTERMGGRCRHGNLFYQCRCSED